MTPKDTFLEGTFWDKFWRPIRSRALLFTPDNGVLADANFEAPKTLFLKAFRGLENYLD